MLLVPSWWPSAEVPIGGIFFLDYARAFAAAGARVGVIFPDLVPPKSWNRRLGLLFPRLFAEKLDDIPVIRVRGVHTSLGEPHRRTLRYRDWLRRGFRRYAKRHGKPDVVHAHCSIPAAWAAERVVGGTVVLTEHTGPFSLLLSPPSVEALTREAVAGAASVVAVSPNLREQMRAAGVEREIAVVPNPVSAEFTFAPPPAPQRAPGGEPIYHGVFIGRLVPEKGVRELARAIEKVTAEREADVHWHLVGDGPEEATLRRALASEPLRRRVTWHGFLPKAEVARVLRESHFLVLPSYGENCPLAVEEALAIGRPVVGTLGTGTEALVGPEDGVLCRARDAGALAQAILAMIRDHGRWRHEAIAERARARFGGAAVAARYAEIFGRARQG